MKKLIIFLVIILVAVVTCPDKEAHEIAVNTELKNMLSKEMQDDNKLTQFFGDAINLALSKVVTSCMLEVDNYFVCSIGRIHFDGKDKYVSFGIFGHVFTLPFEKN